MHAGYGISLNELLKNLQEGVELDFNVDNGIMNRSP